MDSTKARSRGRPFGGIAFIISKSIAFKTTYTHSRCISIFLTEHNVLVNNVYLPANDSRYSVERNEELLIEALGHLEAAHEVENSSLDCITLDDFNSDPADTNNRSRIISSSLSNYN